MAGLRERRDKEGVEAELTWDPQESGGDGRKKREMLDRLD